MNFTLAEKELISELPMRLMTAMRSSLRMVMDIASTRYMIMTGTGASQLPGVKVAVDPARLTWRTGNLARSLVSEMHPQHIQTVEKAGDASIVMTSGTSVPYGQIHEEGGELPAFDMTITERMRRFFWAMFYQNSDEKWKWMALSKKGTISVPERMMPARPFLSRTLADPEVIDRINAMFSEIHYLMSVKFLKTGLGVA